MCKIKIIISFFLLFTLAIQGQNTPLDSLTKTIKTPVTSRKEFNQVQELGYIFRNMLDSIDDNYHSDFTHIFLSAEDWVAVHGSDTEIIFNRYHLLIAYSFTDNYQKTLFLGKELLNQEDVLGKLEISRTIKILFELFRKLELHKEMLWLMPKIQEYNDEFRIRTVGYTYEFDVAMLYYKLKNYEKAIEGFLFQAEKFGREGNQLYKSSMLNNVGLCYFNMDKNDSAKIYFDKALRALEIPSKKGVLTEPAFYIDYFGNVIRGNIAEIDLQNGYYDKALTAFKKELRYKKEITEYGIITGAYTNIAKTCFLKNEPEKALIYIDSSINSITSYNSTSDLVKALKLKGKIHLLLGNFDTAIATLKKQDRLNDSLQKIQIARDYLSSATLYEAEERKKELRTVQQEVLLRKKLVQNQWLALIVISVLLVVVIYFYFKVKTDKRTIATQNMTLESSLQEKEILLKEVHHRVKNNLQVISGLLQIQVSKFTDNRMKNTFDDSQRHIRSMALVHQMLYEQGDISVIPMQAYLDKLVRELLFTLSGKHIEAKIQASEIELSLDRAIPLGLMINELITNANKHAFSENKEGTIEISLICTNKTSNSKDKKTYEFLYKDNGKGLPDNFKSMMTKTLGFRLIYMLAGEMDGTLNVLGDKGVKISLLFSEK